MTPEEKAKSLQEKGRIYNQRVKELQDLIRPSEVELEHQHVNAVSNLGTISGAVAALSLTIFSTNLERVNGLLVFGVVLLLINTAFIFWYLVKRVSDGNRALLKTKERAIFPFQSRVNDVFAAANGELTYEDVIANEEKMYKEMIENRNPYEQGDNQKLQYYDDIALLIFCIAIGCIILSFIWPYMFIF